MTNILWEMFEKSGSVGIYILYKLIASNKEETKEKPSKAVNIE
ncbi:MAG: hypothetical protein ACOYEJ_02210 [Mahellales bacterium]|jgi:hypothetical protein